MTETPQKDPVDTDRVNTAHLRDLRGLHRSVTDRKIAGVAGGLARHLNIDPTILRVAFVVLVFFGGAGLVLYGAAWLLVPEEGKSEAVISTSSSTRNVLLVGAAVVAGLLLLGDSWGGFDFPWPLAIIALVVFVVLMNRDKPMNTQTPTGGTPGPEAGGDTTTVATPRADWEGAPPTEYGAESPPPPWMPPTQQAYQPPSAPPPDKGPRLFGITLALVAIALGALGLYEVAGGTVADAAYPALALTVIGVMLLVGAWVGRAGGLIALGIVAIIALAAASATNPRFHGDRTREYTPTIATQVENRYSVPAGSIHLDMSNIRDVARLDGRTIDVEANAGELVVTLPRGLDAHVVADIAGAGDVHVVGEESSGLNARVERDVDGGVDAPEIDLNLDLVFGNIDVRQP